MDKQGKLLIAVDAEALSRIEADLAEIKALLKGATIQPAPEWVSISHAARIMQVSEETIRRWIRTGRLEAKGANKARRVKVR